MTPDIFRHLVAKASLAPSVHNVQPARWRFDGDTVLLCEDTSVRLPAADPKGQDAATSLGAAFEGLSLAASEKGLSARYETVSDQGASNIRVVARLSFTNGASPDPLAAHVTARQSWRGAFAPVEPTDRDAAMTLAASDCSVLTDPDAIAAVATLLDKASFKFMAQHDFRAELVSWMRLKRSHPDWAKNGLNADAMHLGWVERFGARFVMGPGFKPLNALGLAAPLLAETDKTKGAAGIIAFHRPYGEDLFDSGRAFYRAWLRMEAAGFGATVLAALKDDEDTASVLFGKARVPEGHHLLSAFRIGRRTSHQPVARARQSLEELIL